MTCKKINLFLTSRPEIDIKKTFRGMSTLEMDREHVQRDVATSVEWKLEHDASFEDFSDDLKSEITQKLIAKSNGMYILRFAMRAKFHRFRWV